MSFKATNFSMVLATYVALICLFVSPAVLIYFDQSPWYLVGALAVWQWFIIVGSSAGVHRYFAHRSFETSSFWEWVMGLSAMWSLTGPPCIWADDHVQHHVHSDREGDPYLRYFLNGDSPISHTINVDNRLLMKYCRDRFNHITLRYHWALVLAFPLALALINPWFVFWLWLVPAGLLQLASRIVLWVTHVDGVGYRSFETRDKSRNIWWVSLVAGGEGWHNNHHRFPSLWDFQMKPWEVDFSAWFIRCIKKP